jgi:hypothetical protein
VLCQADGFANTVCAKDGYAGLCVGHPAESGLFGFFRGETECDPSVQWQRFDLDIEAVAVGMCPCGPDTRPKTFAAFAVADNRISLSRG